MCGRLFASVAAVRPVVGSRGPMRFSVVISMFDGDRRFLPRALTGLLNQRFRDFELLVVVDGECRLADYDPEGACGSVLPTKVVRVPHNGMWGFRGRHLTLPMAGGQYVAWLNVDNLVYPNWLLNHFNNVLRQPGAISVVNIQYWHLNS